MLSINAMCVEVFKSNDLFPSLCVFRCTPHETTRILPYRLVFGKEAKLPINIMTDDEKNITSEKEENRSVYVRELQEKLTAIHELARENTKQASRRQKNYFDRNVRETNYEVGQLFPFTNFWLTSSY